MKNYILCNISGGGYMVAYVGNTVPDYKRINWWFVPGTFSLED